MELLTIIPLEEAELHLSTAHDQHHPLKDLMDNHLVDKVPRLIEADTRRQIPFLGPSASTGSFPTGNPIDREDAAVDYIPAYFGLVSHHPYPAL